MQELAKQKPQIVQQQVYVAPQMSQKDFSQDIFLEILDIRSPLEFRCQPKQNCKHVIVLNHCHCVTRLNAEAWQRFFAKQSPTLLYSNSVENYNRDFNTFFNKQSGTVYAISQFSVEQGIKDFLKKRCEGYSDGEQKSLQEMLSIIGPERACLAWNIAQYQNEKDFLKKVGVKCGLKKDEEIEQKVLSDWTQGKIKFQTKLSQ